MNVFPGYAGSVPLLILSPRYRYVQEELREFRRQLGVGRSLKEGSQPEFEEKFNRLQSLRNLRNSYQNKMGSIRETLRGLDCKNEEELDAKVKDLEQRIALGGLTLREEKLVVGQISKLQSQRSQVSAIPHQPRSCYPTYSSVWLQRRRHTDTAAIRGERQGRERHTVAAALDFA
jgi:hypothetical protein